MEVQDKLIPDKTNIVYFSAWFCPYCQKMTPRLKRLISENPEYVVRQVEIRDFESPVWNQYDLKAKGGVPYFQLYDGQGQMQTEGKEARAQLEEAMGES